MCYPPDGVRGVATIVRAASYGATYNENRAEAVKNVDEIAAVDCIGVLFVGPKDLSTSLGIFRQYDHPLFIAALNKTLTAAEKHNRAAGILPPGVETTRHYRDMGFRFITAGTDVLLLRTAAAQLAQDLRDALTGNYPLDRLSWSLAAKGSRGCQSTRKSRLASCADVGRSSRFPQPGWPHYSRLR